jgi:phosphohistidine phosphatase
MKNLIYFFSLFTIGFLHLSGVKRLVIIRHAKSSWANALVEDFDRPLNERGKKDAPLMAKRLKEKKVLPDLMITSPAKRALSTAKKFAKVFDVDKSSIKKEPKLYHASENILLKTAKDINEKLNTVFLVGHNPGLTEFVNITSNLEIDNIPTTGVVVLEISQWSKFGKEKAKAVYFDYPGNIK